MQYGMAPSQELHDSRLRLERGQQTNEPETMTDFLTWMTTERSAVPALLGAAIGAVITTALIVRFWVGVGRRAVSYSKPDTKVERLSPCIGFGLIALPMVAYYSYYG